MTDLVREDRFEFRFGELRDESVEEDDFAKASEAGEERIGMTGAFAAVHDFDVAGWKFGALRQCKKAFAQRTLRKRSELVEEGHDQRRCNEKQEQLERDHDR